MHVSDTPINMLDTPKRVFRHIRPRVENTRVGVRGTPWQPWAPSGCDTPLPVPDTPRNELDTPGRVFDTSVHVSETTGWVLDTPWLPSATLGCACAPPLLLRPRVEQIWHIQDIQGQILALASSQRPLNRFELFPLRSEVEHGFPRGGTWAALGASWVCVRATCAAAYVRPCSKHWGLGLRGRRNGVLGFGVRPCLRN